MKPIIYRLTKASQCDDFSYFVVKQLSGYEYKSDHLFKAFYVYSSEAVELEQLPLIGESVVLKLRAQTFFYVKTEYLWGIATKQHEPLSYGTFLDKTFSSIDDVLTIGIFEHLSSQPWTR